jgi:hypothetical protein
VLVAIFLFGVVMAAMTGVFVATARSVGDQRLRTIATRLATDRLETLRSLPFDQLEAEALPPKSPLEMTAQGRTFVVQTQLAPIDAASGVPAPAGQVKQITVTVRWAAGGVADLLCTAADVAGCRSVSYTTAIAPPELSAVGAGQAITAITMFPSPAVTDANGRPLADVEVTVTLTGFPASALVQVSWTNADGTAGAKSLTSSTGVSWRGTIAKEQIGGAIGADGRGEVQFTFSAGSTQTVHTLALQRIATIPPAIEVATIDRNPVTVAKAAAKKSCADRNQCQNTTDVVFTVTASGLDPAQDSVIVQIQLHDGTFQEAPLTPTGGQWRFTARARTTKFQTGAGRTFRFTATRLADGATASTTVLRDVVSV